MGFISRLCAAALAVTVGAAGVIGAGPAFAGRPLEADFTASDSADFTVRGAAACNTTTAQWELRWAIQTDSQTATVLGMRDPVNDVVFPPELLNLEPMSASNGRGNLPGTAVTAAVEITLRVAGESAVRTFRRSMPLGEPCATATEPTDCVERAQAHYQHTFDPAAGRATVRLDGLPPCDRQYLVLTVSYSPVGYLTPHTLAMVGLSKTYSRGVLQIDRLQCTHTFELGLGAGPNAIAGGTNEPGNRSSGPYAYDAAATGPCTLPGTLETSSCDGLWLTVKNYPDAAMAVSVLVYSADLPDGSRQFWQLTLAPGESKTILIRPTGTPPTAVAGLVVHTFPLMDRVWVQPDNCNVRRVVPRRPTTERPHSPIPRR